MPGCTTRGIRSVGGTHAIFIFRGEPEDVQSAVVSRGADRPLAGGLAVGGGGGRPDARRRRGRVLHPSIDVRLMQKLILLVPAAALLVFAGEGIYYAARRPPAGHPVVRSIWRPSGRRHRDWPSPAARSTTPARVIGNQADRSRNCSCPLVRSAVEPCRRRSSSPRAIPAPSRWRAASSVRAV